MIAQTERKAAMPLANVPKLAQHTYRVTVAGDMPTFYVVAVDVSDAHEMALQITGYHPDLIDITHIGDDIDI